MSSAKKSKKTKFHQECVHEATGIVVGRREGSRPYTIDESIRLGNAHPDVRRWFMERDGLSPEDSIRAAFSREAEREHADPNSKRSRAAAKRARRADRGPGFSKNGG